MQNIFQQFHEAYVQGSGPLLATTLSPIAPPDDPTHLKRLSENTSATSLSQDIRSGLSGVTGGELKLSKGERSAWVEVYAAFWKASGEIVSIQDRLGANWIALYEAWKDVANALIKGYSGGWFEAWTVPCLYVVGRYLRVFAIRADEAHNCTRELNFLAGEQDDAVASIGGNERLEDAARVINRVFTLCISDRAPLEESRRWGLYYATNLLFKTYFKLNSVGLSKNILRALQASRVDMPPLEAFPKSHIVTFKYYVGVILFLDENYEKAEENLTDAFNLCQRDARRNRELILTYLIPCRLLTSHILPSPQLLRLFPRLRDLFVPLCRCIKIGDLAGFDVALAAGEGEFVKRRIYLTLERGRDIALRNVFRKVYIAGGFEEQKNGGPEVRRSRIPVAEFAAALHIGTKSQSKHIDTDEVECLLANMIYKNLMKGYISHERGMAVLSKGSAFPGTGV